MPRRRAASNRRPVSAAAKPAGPREVAAHRARVQHLDRLDGAADDVALEAVADDLDLGQLGHGVSSGTVGRSAVDAERPQPPSSPYAVSAAACSASFLERPTPLP